MSDLEELLAFQLKVSGLPEPVREYKFAASIGRKWRSDFAWPDQKLLVEVDGGIWANGRHTRPQGFQNDAEKTNQAQILGFRILRFTGEQVESGEALEVIEQALGARI